MANVATLPAPRNAWYVGAWSHEVTKAPMARTVMNEKMVFYRGPDGKAAALEDRCSHRATPLSLGEVTDKGIQCGYHGLTFNGDGDCVFIPGQDSIPPQACVRAFPVMERQGFVWVWPGDPNAVSDETLIDYPWNDDPQNWPAIYQRKEVDSNYMLLIDNLMDLTHIPFVHRHTIGGGNAMGQINADVTVKRTDTGVHYIRWMEGIQPPPTYSNAAGFADGILVDRWQELEYVAPMTVLHWTGALETGRGARENREQDGGFQLRVFHGATPATDTSCYYFTAANNGCAARSAEDNERLLVELSATFQEDADILGHQQASLEEDPTRPLCDIKHDTARIHARRKIAKMLATEGTLPLAAE